jgi:tRNA(Arg) A34 adenosine deaminase TadA
LSFAPRWRTEFAMQTVFESKVRQQMERLGRCAWGDLEREVAEKRVAWFKQSHGSAVGPSRSSPRQAYELLFFEYMGLSPEDLPVVSETETEIVWRSLNPCPTLAACQALALDTRQVCRAAYEKSTQALVSQLDPQLRFLRSYTEIRPYAPHCRERLVRVDFEAMMALAIGEAQAARREGNPAYGAVVALGQQVIGKGHDATVTERDSSRHAAVDAIRQAGRALDDSNLSGAILFSTGEPCPKCSALAVQANLTAVVYGLSGQALVQLNQAQIWGGAREILERSPVMIEVISGILEDECRALYA